jgi:O-acetyl-ADP-ribose deacetylase (regulator of RNase III)
MLVKVMLVDVNPRMVEAWQTTFEENPEVEIVHGSMLAMQASAWVSPTNSRGSMDGGLDAILKKHFGQNIETRLQQEIGRVHSGFLPVGHAVCVPTEWPMPRYLISTPTMHSSSEDISDTLNVALACAAAFQAVHQQNAREPGSIRSVALPGLGANTGKVPVEICADLMWTGYQLFRDREFTSYAEMRTALEDQLGDLGPAKPKPPPAKSKPKANGAGGPAWGSPKAKDEDIDFDDAE